MDFGRGKFTIRVANVNRTVHSMKELGPLAAGLLGGEIMGGESLGGDRS